MSPDVVDLARAGEAGALEEDDDDREDDPPEELVMSLLLRFPENLDKKDFLNDVKVPPGGDDGDEEGPGHRRNEIKSQRPLSHNFDQRGIIDP